MLIVHKKHDPYDVYVGRPTKWGNPYMVGRHGKRGECVKKYAEYLLRNPDLMRQARIQLKGKILSCWCAPPGGIDYMRQPVICHAQLLAAIANG